MTKRNLPYFLALLLEVVLFHRLVLISPGYLFPWDFRAVHLPLATFVADSFRRGEFPLWDPYTYCGNPIFANIQTALFYPPVLLATLLSVLFDPARLPWLLTLMVAIQIFFAGLCTFALLRRLGAPAAAAWIAATMYELGCFFASQAEHMGAIHGATWLPLAWLAVIELGSRFRWSWVATLSLALSMSVLSGLPQVAVAVFGSSLCLGIALVAFRISRWGFLFRILLAWMWALLLAAVQVIPTFELTRNSVAKYRAEWLGAGGGIKLGALYSLVMPNYWGIFDLSKFHGPSDPTFLYLYSRMLGLLLAVAAICWKPDRWTRAFAVLMLAATIWMLGDSTPVGRTIFMALPVSIRIGIHPEFTLCVFSLGVAVLAGLGAKRFVSPAWLQVLVGMVIAFELVAVGSGRPMNTASVVAAPGVAQTTGLIATLRGLTGSTVPPSRFDMTENVPFEWSSSAPLIGIYTANGCDPMALERVIQVRLSFTPGKRWGTCYQVVNTSSPVLRLINDRYLLSLPESGGYRISEVAGALPRFFFVNRVQRVNSLAEAANALHAASFDPEQVAIVEGFETPLAAGARTVDMASYTSSEVTLRTHTTTSSFLVVTDTNYPGWEATIDGNPAEIFYTDVAYRGILVPAGEHRIVMRFVPRSLYWALALSALAWLGAILSWILRSPAARSATEHSRA